MPFFDLKYEHDRDGQPVLCCHCSTPLEVGQRVFGFRKRGEGWQFNGLTCHPKTKEKACP